MAKQLLRTVNPENAAKELTRVAETVTCLECCKFYILPETAICGHTLCHGCWIGRHTCPVCALPVKRRTLRSNAVLKRYTECVQKATALFEIQYNIRMEEFASDPLPHILNKIVGKDPSKTVNAWLCDSQNHFSAPVSTQVSALAESPAVEVKTCEIQVHTGSKKVASPTKVIHAPPPPQDDWDKIESIPDTEEFVKNKENVGPNIEQHIEPLILDNDEYTTDHPRRSSRKREHKYEPKPSETSGDKHSSSYVSMDTDKLSKTKQNWSNVKKMRKEFSKLHKKNKSKLNISIEMCKKTKSTISNPIVAIRTPVETESEKVILIDDCTPNIKQDEKEKSPVFDEINVNTNNKHDNEDNSNKSPENTSAKEKNSLQMVADNQDTENVSKIDHKTNSSSILNHFKSVNNHVKESIPTPNEIDKLSTPILHQKSKSNVPFLKKSGLQLDKSTNDLINNSEHVERVTKNTVQSVNHVVNDNIETDSDDIQITIKIGSTLTNIFIKKKKNDVKLKLNTDQEAQTTQCMEKSTSTKVSPSAPKNCDVQNIEINIGAEGVVSASTQQIKSNEATVDNIKVNLNKTESAKKNTDSAETIPVEISPSLEKALSKILMEHDDDNNDEIQKNKTQNKQVEVNRTQSATQNKQVEVNKTQSTSQKKQKDINKVSSTYTASKDQNTEDIELDEDMFASGSVQENVQLLKASKPAPSEVFIPTLKTRKQTQTQRQADKRNRENDDETTSNKKAKVSEIYEDSVDDVAEDNKNESSINYDAVMGQVFASIDADMGNVDKSQSIIEIDEDKTLVDKQSDNTVVTQHSQFLKTQKTQRKVLGLSKLANISQNMNSKVPPKDSESLFALSNVDSQIITQKGQNQKHGPETQAHIENLLTPGMCRDLAASEPAPEGGGGAGSPARAGAGAGSPARARGAQEEVPATPHDRDDSDTSVCEETPQKASPYTRKSATSNDAQQKLTQSQLHPAESQLIKEIISISDTDQDATVVSKPKQTFETPTINQFCNSVQHNSTPVARKSLNFGAEQSSNTQEFTKPKPPPAPKYCVATSCLTAAEVKRVELLCAKRGWRFVKEFTNELTHLVVKADEDGRSQRTVKFMCALAAGCWIVRYEWAEASLRRGGAPEGPYEALDWTGEPGPARARTAARKLFDGFTFFCMPPFSVLSEPVLKVMLECAGGRVVSAPRDVRVTGDDVRLLLAEPEHTQEDQFTYLALELSIVPVNYEWALNCLGSYSLSSIVELMLCPGALLPAAAARWPPLLVAQDDLPADGSD